jgi:hypothetical protein
MGQVLDLQPAMPPKMTAKLFQPLAFRKLAATMDRMPLPQKTYTSLSLGTSSILFAMAVM